MSYEPKPIDTSEVQLAPEITKLIERLAENAHDVWSAQRLADSWTWGPSRDDAQKKHPCLVPYAQLPDSEKQYDRNTAMETLQAIVALGYQISPSSRVTWLPRARNQIRQKDRIPSLESELRQVFPKGEITISDVFRGYSNIEERKIILGVLVRDGSDAPGSHIVKLGIRAEVQSDVDGWRTCIAEKELTSRMLLPVEGHLLDSDRHAVVYQDAYALFGADPEHESPKHLEVAARWAITDSQPSADSVEQVFIQIFNELNRCLYQGCNNTDSTRVRSFYSEKLKKGGNASAWEKWDKDGFCRLLRRDAIWLITARDKPDEKELPHYLDPFDYVRWALENGRVPPTLVGKSHGDLHGRNILVGVSRGKVEQPAIFDYGEMSGTNLPVWDFVKLETELKTRIIPGLFYDEEAKQALYIACPPVRPTAVPHAMRLSPEEQEVADRADRMEFAFLFETHLTGLTQRIDCRAAAERPLTADQWHRTGHPAIDKALRLLHRIRQEAAICLGYRIDRPETWRDEYFFALTVYGVLKSRWELAKPEMEWSLISAGVAAAQLSDCAKIQKERKAPPPVTPPASPHGSHHVPLCWSHALWKSRDYERACQMIESGLVHFPNAVTLNVEHALCLLAKGDRQNASNQIAGLRRLCHIFRDHEALCRLGRMYKDSGDDTWETDETPPDIKSFHASEHPARQLYQEAFEFYHEAFEFSRDYFPGINAATLALLIGRESQCEELTKEVERACRQRSIEDAEERFWVYATEGEAALLRRAKTDARRFYAAALATPHASDLGMVQSVYNQLCRLHWALGADIVQPVVNLLMDRQLLDRLAPGPFGNCGCKS